MGQCTRAICTDRAINIGTALTTVSGAVGYAAYGIYTSTAASMAEVFRTYCPNNSTLVSTPLGSYSCQVLERIVDTQKAILPLGSWTIPLLTFAAGAFISYKACMFYNNRRYISLPSGDDF